MERNLAAYWIPRSSRGMTAVDDLSAVAAWRRRKQIQFFHSLSWIASLTLAMTNVGRARKGDPVAEYDGVGWSIGPMVGLSIRFCPGKPVSTSHQAPGGLFRTMLGAHCILSVHPVAPRQKARLVTGQLQFGHESEIRLSVRPGRV
jgi:hypothetical protein